MPDLNQKGQINFAQQEQNCEQSFIENGPFWHLCTPGKQTELLFKDDEDFKFAISLLAISAAAAGCKVITFEIMSNHLHALLEGRKEDCLSLFDMFSRKLCRYFQSKRRYVKLTEFQANLIPVNDLKQLRIEIAYIHRNGYLASPKYLPYTYPWGSGQLYFNKLAYAHEALSFNEAGYNEKRRICCGRIPELPDSYLVSDGMILPQSFCDIALGESMFRGPHHYFSLISKNFEAYSLIASRIGDDIFLDDEEMFAVLSAMCRKLFGDSRPSMLPPRNKIELAKVMKKDYNASNGQIQRMLRLDRTLVEELFGR